MGLDFKGPPPPWNLSKDAFGHRATPFRLTELRPTTEKTRKTLNPKSCLNPKPQTLSLSLSIYLSSYLSISISLHIYIYIYIYIYICAQAKDTEALGCRALRRAASASPNFSNAISVRSARSRSFPLGPWENRVKCRSCLRGLGFRVKRWNPFRSLLETRLPRSVVI